MFYRRISFSRILFFLFFFFFLFSNLLSRIVGRDINVVFYIVWFFAFVYSIGFVKWNSINVFTGITVLFFVVYIADSRSLFSTNLLTIKDFIIPILTYYLGYFLSKTSNNADIFKDLNVLFLVFISYGVVQALVFYTGNFNRLLPWDANWVAEIISTGPNNIFQPGGLLRFFGTMNSFVEYQITALFFGAFLWVSQSKIYNKFFLYINIFLMISFMILSIERTPIVMGVILLFSWKIKPVATHYKMFLRYALTIIAVGFLVVSNLDFFESNILISGAYKRLYNVITLNLSNDSAIMLREKNQWTYALNLAEENFLGIGPGRLSPGAASIDPQSYVAPHNNFLAFYLAYGFLGLFLFVSLLLLGAKYFSYLEDDFRLFGYGLILSFACSAFFNMSYIGKQGIVFFLIFGYLSGQFLTKKTHEK